MPYVSNTVAASALIAPPAHLLNASIVELGDHFLIAPLLRRLRMRRHVTIVGIGSSITARHGGCTHSLPGASSCVPTSQRSNGWLRIFFDGMNATWPNPRHRLLNAGMPASAPTAFTECLTWLPDDVDIYILEFVAARDVADLAVRLLTRKPSTSARSPMILFVAWHRWIMPMEGAHNRIMRTARAAGMPFISQLHGLGGFRGVPWAQMTQQARRCADGVLRAGDDGSGDMCWGPAVQAPDGLHPTTRVGQAFMGFAMLEWLHRADRNDAQPHRSDDSPEAALGLEASVRRLTGGSRSMASRRVTLACFTLDARRMRNASALGEALREGAHTALLDAAAAAYRSKNVSFSPSTWLQAAAPIETARLASHHVRRHGNKRSTSDVIGPDGGLPAQVVSRRGFAYMLDFPGGSASWLRGTSTVTSEHSGDDRGSVRVDEHPAGSGNDQWSLPPIREAKASLAGFCPGDSVTIDVSLGRAGGGSRPQQGKRPKLAKHAGTVASLIRPYVSLDHLTSWAGMGRALLECVQGSGCVCVPSVLDGHVPEEHASLRAMHTVEVSTLERCAIRLTVLNESYSGEHRVKLMRIAVGGHMPMPDGAAESLLVAHPSPPLPPPPPPPPPPPTCQTSGLRGDASGFKRCEAFCRAKNAPRHCLLCKCSACAFCDAEGQPVDGSKHNQRDMAAAAAARRAAAATAREAALRTPPPPPPVPPPSGAGPLNGSTGLFVCSTAIALEATADEHTAHLRRGQCAHCAARRAGQQLS